MFNQGKVFSQERKVYKLNTLLNILEENGFENVQDIVQSSADCALDKIIDKFGFLPKSDYQIKDVDGIADFTQSSATRDLESLQQAYATAEGLRDKYQLSDFASIEDIYKEVSMMSDKLKVKIDNYVKLSKEVSVNETAQDK